MGDDDGGDNIDELYNEIMQQWRAKQLIEIINEVDKYITDPFEKLNSSTGEFDLLLWWKVN
ncbi:hypothetical protein LguiA_005299 [Lonicera macranthoides]